MGLPQNPLNAHFLSFKTVRNKKKGFRVDAHYLVAHLHGLKRLWDMPPISVDAWALPR